MSILIQNDEGTIENANSYVSVQEFKDYWTARNVDYSSKTDVEIEAALISALSYLDNRFVYAGYKLNGREQTTEFPRNELYDCSGAYPELVEGVPREVKEAQNEYSHIHIEQGFLQPNANTNGAVKRKKETVGPIEEEIEYFSAGETGGVVSYPQADNKIPNCFKSIASSQGLLIHT